MPFQKLSSSPRSPRDIAQAYLLSGSHRRNLKSQPRDLLLESLITEQFLSNHLADKRFNLLGIARRPFSATCRFDRHRAAVRATPFISKSYKRYSKKVLERATIFNDSVQHPNCRHGRAQ
jgi:hypothetical protein